jgi:hypothetical protein
LTRKGHDLVRRLRPLWDAIAKASDALVKSSAPSILTEIDALEAALEDMPMSKRLEAFFEKTGRKKEISA